MSIDEIEKVLADYEAAVKPVNHVISDIHEHMALQSKVDAAHSKLVNLAPEALRSLLTVAKIAADLYEPTDGDGQTLQTCLWCGGTVQNIPGTYAAKCFHEDDCNWVLLQEALKELKV